MTRRFHFVCLWMFLSFTSVANASAGRKQAETPSLPLVEKVAAQPLLAQAKRLAETLERLGSPLPPQTAIKLRQAARRTQAAQAVRAVQQALDPHCLLSVHINPESRVKIAQGQAKPELVQEEWRLFLIKVHNEAGTTAALRFASPNAEPTTDRRHRWLQFAWFPLHDAPAKTLPPEPHLSGLPVEYCLLALSSRDSGPREATIAFDVGQGTQDLGFRNAAAILFSCLPTFEVTLRAQDTSGQPTAALFTVRDARGRSYPSPLSKPSGEILPTWEVSPAEEKKLRLPKGTYTIMCRRGPEHPALTRKITIGNKPQTLTFSLKP